MPFNTDIKLLLTELAENMTLNILVWGPTTKDPGISAKRVQIRDRLREVFKKADVQFSEDIEGVTREAFEDTDNKLSHVDLEQVQLMACDVCIVLDGSPGAAAEIAVYSRSADCGKLCVFTPEKYKNVASFAGEVRRHLHLEHYTDEEYAKCSLVARAVTHVRNVAVKKRAYRV